MDYRSFNTDQGKYKFTSKERDAESNYDYFGARYYDSRIANWGSVDPLLEKHKDWTPYNYVLRNPTRLIDPDGKQKVPYLLSDVNKQDWSPATENREVRISSSGHVVPWSEGPTETGAMERPVIDPIDLFAGAIGFKFASQIGIKVGENIVGKEISEVASKNIVNEASEVLSEFLGKGSTPHLNEVGDTYFLSADKLRTVRFDIKKFYPHDLPHIDIERSTITNFGKKIWENIGKIWIKN